MVFVRQTINESVRPTPKWADDGKARASEGLSRYQTVKFPH